MNRNDIRRILQKYFEDPVVGGFSYLGFSPNGVTILGLMVAGLAAAVISFGYLWVGGIVMLAGACLDLVDGSLARRKGLISDFGALLDSVLDRLQEAIILLGLLIYFLRDSNDVGIVLVYTTFVSSVMVSYLRARSEGLGIECKTGLMTRPERVVIMSGGIIASAWIEEGLFVCMAVISVLGLMTVAQRLIHSFRMFRRKSG